MQRPVLLASVFLFSSIAWAQSAIPDLACRWSAQLTAARPGVSDSYLVPFNLLIEHSSTGLRGALLNGSDRMDFSTVTQNAGEVVLRLDQYDSTLKAHCASATCNALEGEYTRQKGSSISRYTMNARCERSPSSPAKVASAATQVNAAGDWRFTFTDQSGKPDSEPNAPANFTQNANHVEGTIAPVSGDYGMLSGDLIAGRGAESDKATELHLSRFDGIHALRLDGHFVTPDRIEGVFHVSPASALNFVATRSASTFAGFDEAEHLTTVQDTSVPFRFQGLDASGTVVTQDDPRFREKVVLIDIFGTWCPNCHDEAPVLQSLYTQFHARGLEVVGLSYEYVEDHVRNQRLLGIYRNKYSIAFPLLLAGTTDSGQIARTLPQLRNFGAYPTTIFLDRHGRVRMIHAGFSGPATGHLEEVKQSFERTVAKLLDEQ
ncbi:MAG TPA: TlpA disulfide reductase family protein [Candidatus Saccharimonadales bacterium]|nr:TlpA disulfide reductase family protein [Candidatus Saccharimonadales bacterium]